MNAVDEIQEAIGVLEQARAESTPGSWVSTWDEEEDAYHIHESKGEYVLGKEIAEAHREADTDLIAILHRTIDAQLAILDCGLHAYRHMDGFKSVGVIGSMSQPLDHDRAALQLARAINGATK